MSMGEPIVNSAVGRPEPGPKFGYHTSKALTSSERLAAGPLKSHAFPAQIMAMPPFTWMVWPVMYPPSSDAR
jgi:hypothetical protein